MSAPAIRGLLVVVTIATLRTAPSVSAAAPGASSLRSYSGQFVVSTLSPGSASPRLAPTNSAVVELQAPTLVISCERVKQALLRELAYVDAWRGRLYVVVNPQMTNDQPAVIGARQFTDGWQYRVELPVQSSRLKVVRGLVHALLLEMANRAAVNRSAEVPLWLVEGLTLHLARSSLIDLVASDPRVTMNRVTFSASARQAIRPDPLADARERLQSRTAFSFARLGEVTVDQLNGENWETFQASAQLLVSQLLLLPNGRLALAEMIAQLGVHPNWQTAFLNAFSGHFGSMLDVEKWWSVVLVHFTGLDPLHAWSPEVAWNKLGETLLPPVLVSNHPKEPPQRQRLPLQRLLREWDFLRQRTVLRSVVSELVLMRVRLPPEFVSVADDYREVIGKYLTRSEKAGPGRAPAGAPPTAADRLILETTRQLDELDRRREQLRPKSAVLPGSAVLEKGR